MTARAVITERLPIIFGLPEPEAAAAIGISATKFRQMVDAGMMPRPRRAGSRVLWDVDELRAAFKALPRDGETAQGADEPNPWD